MAAVMTTAFAPKAHAVYTVTVTESGSDVVAAGAGSLDVSGLSFHNTSMGTPQISGLFDVATGGPPGPQNLDVYYGIASYPTSMGSGLQFFPDSGSGDVVGASHDTLYVPVGYAGGALSSTQTFNNRTLVGMGLTPGTYTWSWSSDSYRVVIGTVEVTDLPEPASVILLGVPAVGMMLRTGRRDRGRRN